MTATNYSALHAEKESKLRELRERARGTHRRRCSDFEASTTGNAERARRLEAGIAKASNEIDYVRGESATLTRWSCPVMAR